MIAIDFETYYSSKTYSVVDKGYRGYVEDPRFCAYLLSAYGTRRDGTQVEFVGDPCAFDWKLLEGEEVWAHNKAFDWAVWQRLVQLGLIPATVDFQNWHCSSDLSVFCGLPRALANVVSVLFGRTVDKSTRANMDGKKPEDMGPKFWEEVLTYGLTDSKECLALAEKLGPLWPQEERVFSNLTIAMGWRGVPVNRDRLEAGILKLKTILHEAEKTIPWEGKPLEKKLAAAHFRSIGVEPPKSRAKGSITLAKWLEEAPEEASRIIKAQGLWQSANTLLSKLTQMYDRCYWTSSGWWMSYEMKYGGGHTLRDSGGRGGEEAGGSSKGVNMQNLPREEMFCEVDENGKPVAGTGVDVRSYIEAPPGYSLLIADYSQIEPRVLAVLTGDTKFLELLHSGVDPYEAHARLNLGYTDPEPLAKINPTLRHFAKERVLALAYGIGFETWARQMIAKKVEVEPATPAEMKQFLMRCKADVAKYRRTNPLVTGLWKQLETGLAQSVGQDFSVRLPSGRSMRYWRVHRDKGSFVALVQGSGKLRPIRLWGGKLTENLVQAVARDVFRDGVLAVERAGFPVLARVHDELITICREDQSEEMSKRLYAVLKQPPNWLPQIPLSAKVVCSKRYEK